jgi:hypothetical protein
MKRLQLLLKFTLAAMLTLFICLPGFSYKVGGTDLVKNGAGSRTKYMMKVYTSTLYVPADLQGADGKQIIEADQPMAIDMFITSGLITKDKFVGSIAEAFDQSAKVGYPCSDKQNYINLFNDVTIGDGDTVSNRYDPAKGLSVVFTPKGGQAKTLGVLKGLQTKKGFFGMFLSSSPIQDSLKKNLLSGK